MKGDGEDGDTLTRRRLLAVTGATAALAAACSNGGTEGGGETATVGPNTDLGTSASTIPNRADPMAYATDGSLATGAPAEGEQALAQLGGRTVDTGPEIFRRTTGDVEGAYAGSGATGGSGGAAGAGGGKTPAPAPTSTTPPTTAATTTTAPGSSTTTSTTAPATTTTTAPPAPPPEPTIELAVNRLSFGATPGQVSALQQGGDVWTWIDDQLTKTGPDPAVESLLTGLATLTNSNAANEAIGDTSDGRDRIRDEMRHATLLRAALSEHQLHEMMCDFWFNHFNINLFGNSSWVHLQPDDLAKVARAHSMGNFRDMLLASAHSPAMLVYLDNYTSDATSGNGINENWGRELLELHTLGIIDGQQVYTEADVRGAAMIMSGWSIEQGEGNAGFSEFLYRPDYHTTDAVSILDGAFSRGAPADLAAAQADGDALLEFLVLHPSTAEYLAYKLVKRFVTDTPPQSLVASTAQVYLANNTAIIPMLRHIFDSDEFALSSGLKMRRPFELAVAMLRRLQAQIAVDAGGHAADRLMDRLEDLGQPLYDWPTPDGYPDDAPEWVSADALLQRWRFAADLVRNRVTNDSEAQRVDVAILPIIPDPLPATAAELVQSMSQYLLDSPLPNAVVNMILASLNYAPNDAAADVVADAGDTEQIIAVLLTHPAFQYR
ncbi:MAG: DUF1800 domain-containing protein [Actinomycetia bacterium]|nr:DUF1800 domain-containing protein [Actinomycetes bacterium]